MKGQVNISVPEFALVAVTRAALGVGIGLLLANRFSEPVRKGVDRTLLLVGAVTTVPLAMEIFGRSRSLDLAFGSDRGRKRAAAEPQQREPGRLPLASRPTTVPG